MYSQIFIHPDDRNYQLILWRDKADQPVQTYRLKTVVFGLKASPYLALRCLQQIAIENASKFPETAKTLLKDFYVDDLLTGANTISHLNQIRNELNTLLLENGFQLRKFASNNKSVLPECNNSLSETVISLDKQEENKTLGLNWNFETNVIKFSVNSSNHNNCTKRTILSVISRLFDPLGLVSPITVVAKIILQEIWKAHVGWDDIHYQRKYK